MADLSLVLAGAAGAFAGGGLGATATLLVARLREQGSRREEWYRRFTHVTGLVLSTSPGDRDAGIALLIVLLDDPLAGSTERRLGAALYAEVLRSGSFGGLLRDLDLDDRDLLGDVPDPEALDQWRADLVLEDDVRDDAPPPAKEGDHPA